MNTSLRLSIAVVAIGSMAIMVRAQQETKRDYIEFKFNPNVEKTLHDRLKMEKELGPFKDLVKEILRDPSKMPMTEKDLKNLKLDDENFKKALKEWAANDPELREALKEWVKKNPPNNQQPNVKKMQDEMKKLLDEKKLEPFENKKPDPVLPVQPVKPNGDNNLAKTAENVMKKAENSRVGDYLRESPAWQRAFTDFQKSLSDPKVTRFKLSDWQDKFKLPEGRIKQLGEGALERAQKLPRPNLGEWAPGLPDIRMPAIAAPALPNVSGPSLPSLGSAATIILLVIVLLLVGWQLLRWSKRSAPAAVDPRVKLGPWPVRPENVSTRTELVLAFDYLALLTLGMGVQSWNHHAVARKWRDQAPALAGSADSLESLYEQARYTDGVDALTDTQRDQARRSLAQLAEAL